MSARRKNEYISLGKEMMKCFKRNQPMPKVVTSNPEDGILTRSAKHIIENMTRFSSKERMSIEEVYTETKGMAVFMTNVCQLMPILFMTRHEITRLRQLRS